MKRPKEFFSRALYLLNRSLSLLLLCSGTVALTFLAGNVGAVFVTPELLPQSENHLTAEAVSSAMPTPTPTSCPTATKCATSRWSAEGNANDSNGLNPGILTNGATFGTGAVGQAFSLDGLPGLNGDYVEAPITTPAMNQLGSLGSFTWEACVNPTSLANNPVVFSKELTVSNRAGLQLNANGSICSYMNSGNCAATSAPGVITTGHFTRVTLLYDGSTNSLVTYVNGIQVSSATVAVPYNNSAPFHIGWSKFGSGNTHFPGLIDEVTFSSCAVRPTLRCCGPTSTPLPSPTPIP